MWNRNLIVSGRGRCYLFVCLFIEMHCYIVTLSRLTLNLLCSCNWTHIYFCPLLLASEFWNQSGEKKKKTYWYNIIYLRKNNCKIFCCWIIMKSLLFFFFFFERYILVQKLLTWVWNTGSGKACFVSHVGMKYWEHFNNFDFIHKEFSDTLWICIIW